MAISHCQFSTRKRRVLKPTSTRIRIFRSSTGTAMRPLVVGESTRRLTQRVSVWRPARLGMTSNSQRPICGTSCSTGLNDLTVNAGPDNSTLMKDEVLIRSNCGSPRPFKPTASTSRSSSERAIPTSTRSHRPWTITAGGLKTKRPGLTADLTTWLIGSSSCLVGERRRFPLPAAGAPADGAAA